MPKNLQKRRKEKKPKPKKNVKKRKKRTEFENLRSLGRAKCLKLAIWPLSGRRPCNPLQKRRKEEWPG